MLVSRRAILASLLVIVFTTVLITPVLANDWPMFHNNQHHSGYAQGSAPHSNATLWNYTMDGSGGPSPAVADGMVFTASRNGYVYALDHETGEKIWNNTVGGTQDASPAVANGMVFVASGNRILALDEYTGVEGWTYTFGTLLRSSPIVADGMVFVVDVLGNLRALNQSTGAVEWSGSAGVGFGLLASSPAIADGMIFIGADYSLFALDEFNGTQIWELPIGDRIRWSSPAVADGMVFVGAETNKIYGVNEFSGVKVWEYTTSADVQSSPAVADGVVFIGSYDGKVYALNQTTGAWIWDYTTGGAVHSSPAVADGLVIVGSNDNKVYALNQSTGSVIWSYTTGGAVQSSPAIANGLVFVCSNDNNVYTFGSLPVAKTLDVDVSVGSPVFRGDILDFYVLTTIEGQSIGTSITSVILFYGNGTILADLTGAVLMIALGVYRIPYEVPPDLANDSYYLIVNAHYPGGVEYEEAFGAALCSFLVSSTLTEWAAWLAEINATLVNIQGSLAVVQSDIGTLMLDLASINASIVGIQGSIVIIESDIGSIQVGLAALSASLSGLMSELEDWNIITADLVVDGATFDLQVLTNSTIDDWLVTSNSLTVTLSGSDNTNGVAHVWVPKNLLEEIGSNIEQTVVTINEELVDFVVIDGVDSFVLSVIYNHSVNVVRVYLEGLPPVFPWRLMILSGGVVIIAIVVVFFVYRIKMKS